MKTRMLGVICTAAVLGLGAAAHAGRYWYSEIVVTTNTSGDPVAFGSMGNAYNSADNLQYLFCWADVHPGASNAMCWASDNMGRWFACSTTDADLIRSIQSINGDTFVQVTAHAGNCTEVYVTKGSAHQPKRP